MRQQILYRFCLFLITGFFACLGLHLFTFRSFAIAQEPVILQELPRSLSDTANKVGKNQLQDKAVSYYAAGQYREAIKLWTEALSKTSDQKQLATLHTNLGSAYRQVGSLGQAIKEWEAAVKIYRSIGDRESKPFLAQVLTEQAQAYNALGQPRNAVPILESVLKLRDKTKEETVEAAANGAIGNAYLALGDFEKAIASHQASLEIAEKLKNRAFLATGWNNLGNVYNSRYQRYLLQANSAEQEGDDKEVVRLRDLAQQDRASAQTAYERSIQESQSIGGIQQAKALLNLARFLQQQSDTQDLIATYREQATSILESIPDSRPKAYALINLAESLDSQTSQSTKIKNLETAIAVTRNIGDLRAESFALTALGKVYSQAGSWSKAMELTQQAQFAAQQVNAPDSLYRAQAQAGRIYKAQGQIESGLVSYRQAIATLQSIRGDMAVASKDLQFDLRDSVEPIYREMMALLLDNKEKLDNELTKEAGKNKKPGSPVKEVLQISELLQLSELQNFFGDECVQVTRSTPNSKFQDATKDTAFIHSLVLNERTYMVLNLPNGSLNSYPVELPPEELAKKIDRLRYTLEDISTDEYLAESQKVYDLLIRPMADDLALAQPKTLVFVNDGVLRNIPMAALHDGKQFLIEKYPIATTLSFNLTPNNSEEKTAKEAAIFGLSVEIPPFAPLPYVKAETEGLHKILGGKRFLDNDFTLANLQKQIDKVGYPIIHLATHGKFGADYNSTFLQLFDQRVSLSEFESVLRRSKKPIELLTLSACQTAAGDSRATLGLAGVALRAGVQSALASLWFVNDADTVPLIQNFYTQIDRGGISKVEALRQAQLKIIADANGHPAIWSPFVLVGNWQ